LISNIIVTFIFYFT